MDKKAKIYIAGHRGLVGSALMRQLQTQGYENLVTRTHDELDLTNQLTVEAFFNAEKPEYVFLAAAKVGGIHANNTYPAEFIHENLAIQTNVYGVTIPESVRIQQRRSSLSKQDFILLKLKNALTRKPDDIESDFILLVSRKNR